LIALLGRREDGGNSQRAEYTKCQRVASNN